MPAGSNTSSARRQCAAFWASGSGTCIAFASSRVVKGASIAGSSAAGVGGPVQLDPLEHLDQAPLARVAQVAAAADRRGRADVVLAAEQDLDRQVRVAQQRREADEALEDRGGRRLLR